LIINPIDLQTSGTTGIPKMIRTDKQMMVNSALATGVIFELSPGDKALYIVCPRNTLLEMMLVRSFILGLDVDFVAPSSHPLTKNETKYDFVAMVPLQVENSLAGLKTLKIDCWWCQNEQITGNIF
jgi:O-succinylbenzoic acid--CoA ligase